MAWKNGGGSTREIAIWPPETGLDDFLWRVSLATLEVDGPFSVFEQIDRHIMLVEGRGVRLHSPDGRIDHPLTRPYQPFAFSGDVPIRGDLVAGPSVDLNVMGRRDRGAADLRVATTSLDIEPALCGAVLCLAGRWRVDADDIAEGEGLRWLGEPCAPRLLACQPDCAIAIATWHPTE